MEPNLQQVIVVAGVAQDKNSYLLMRRKEGLLTGYWEFPGGKVLPGEDLKRALQREIREELGLNCYVGNPVGVGHFPGGIVIGFGMELDVRPTKSQDHDKIEWVEAKDVLNYKLAPADYEIAVSAMRHRVEIEKFGVASLIRLFAGVYALFGLVIAFGLYFVGNFLTGFMPPEMAATYSGYGTGALFLLPVFYGFAGVVIAAVISGFYNLLAKFFGGIQFELRSR